jgi:hypothetical protein
MVHEEKNRLTTNSDHFMTVIYRLLAILVFMFLITISYGKTRVIKGTVYTKDGKKAAGVIVTAHRSNGKYFTSFDGTYEINADIKSKWLKFTFPDRVEILNIERITRDVIDFGKSMEWNKSDMIRRNQIDKKISMSFIKN